MLHDVEWVDTALAVRTVTDRPMLICSTAMAADAIYSRLERGSESIIKACSHMEYAPSNFPLAVISLYQPGIGFGWFYLDLRDGVRPSVLTCGWTDEMFDLPMPTTPEPHSSVMVMRSGLIRLRSPVIHFVQECDRYQTPLGASELRPGWDIDQDLLDASATLAAGNGQFLLTSPFDHSEDN